MTGNKCTWAIFWRIWGRCGKVRSGDNDKNRRFWKLRETPWKVIYQARNPEKIWENPGIISVLYPISPKVALNPNKGPNRDKRNELPDKEGKSSTRIQNTSNFSSNSYDKRKSSISRSLNSFRSAKCWELKMNFKMSYRISWIKIIRVKCWKDWSRI